MTLTTTRVAANHRSVARLEEFFGPQRTPTRSLPPAETFARNVVRGVLEVLAGVREVEQLARWLSEDVYRSLTVRASLAARARSARRVTALRDAHEIRTVRVFEPADGIVEATVTAAARVRTRAIALRLEGLDGRWRVTALALL